MNWDDYRYFLALSRAQTLKKAARTLKVDQATVGRRIAALEEQLGSRLFEKRSNGYFLTASGLRIQETIASTEESFLSVERLIAGKDEKIEGLIKVAMPGALANHWIIPRLRAFIKKYPEIELQFLTGPELVNLARREADMALRLVRPTQKDLLTKKIGSLEFGLYASKNLEISNKPEDLEKVPFIGLYDSATSEMEKAVLKKLEFKPNYRLRSAAWSSVFSAINAELGIGILPTFIGDNNNQLRLIWKDRSSATPLWLVVHPEIAKNARVRALVDYLNTIL